jgi:hypothetical protein
MPTNIERLREFSERVRKNPALGRRTKIATTGPLGITPKSSTRARVNYGTELTSDEKSRRQLEQERISMEKKRIRGRASTLYTGGSGLLDVPTTSRRSLMGY